MSRPLLSAIVTSIDYYDTIIDDVWVITISCRPVVAFTD